MKKRVGAERRTYAGRCNTMKMKKRMNVQRFLFWAFVKISVMRGKTDILDFTGV